MDEIKLWTNIKETEICKEEFCKKMDEIVDKVSNKKEVYIITENGEKKYALCPLDMFNIFKSDNFSCVLNSAIRYALGRDTYMPSVICDFVKANLTVMLYKTLDVMEKDIREYIKDFPDMRQRCLWEDLLKDVQNEMERRKNEK